MLEIPWLVGAPQFEPYDPLKVPVPDVDSPLVASVQHHTALGYNRKNPFPPRRINGKIPEGELHLAHNRKQFLDEIEKDTRS